MKRLNITRVATEQKKLLFKICRENGYSIGRGDDSDDSIINDILICKEEKCVLDYSPKFRHIYFHDLNISKLVKWLNGEDDIFDSHFPKKIVLNATVVGKDITIFLGVYKGYTVSFA